MVRLILNGIAVLILLGAGIKYFQHLRSGFNGTERKAPNQSSTTRVQHKWLDKKTLLIVDTALGPASNVLKYGDVVRVFESVSFEQECFVGLFSFAARRENSLVLRSAKNIPKSNFSVWARLHKKSLALRLEIPTEIIQPLHVSTPCRSWREVSPRSEKESVLNVREKFFLSSRNFSSIHIFEKNSGVQINSHPTRAGWTITAPAGQHQLTVRHADSGIRHHLNIRVDVNTHMYKRRGVRKNSDRIILDRLIIPGWD